jgi:hypothetical protein
MARSLARIGQWNYLMRVFGAIVKRGWLIRLLGRLVDATGLCHR